MFEEGMACFQDCDSIVRIEITPFFTFEEGMACFQDCDKRETTVARHCHNV
jgi:hypothetical protein